MPKTKAPEIIEEDPPRPGPVRKYDWDAFADAARARPNKWIKVYDDDSIGYFQTVKAGDNPTLAAEKGFEVRSANNTRGRPATHPDGFEPRRCSMYLKYVPSQDKTKRQRRTTTKNKEA